MNSLSHLPIKTIFQVADAYKLSHWNALPPGTTRVFSNLTPRGSRIPGVTSVMVFGVQYAIAEMHDMFQEFFFNHEEADAVNSYASWWKQFFGTDALPENCQRVVALHNLGYLPLEILALPEGSLCPIGVPMWTITNTHPDFAWLTNFVETMLSSLVWDLVTEATIGAQYKKNFVKFANQTSDNLFMPDFQGHDFSMRGMRGVSTAATGGMAWLVNFKGSDTMPAVAAIEKHYPVTDINTLIATSVPASEHSLESSYLYNVPNYFAIEEVQDVEGNWEFVRLLTQPQFEDENVTSYLPPTKVGDSGS